MSKKFESSQYHQDKSILAHQLDNAPWVNDKGCLMTDPPFLAYIPTGVLPHSISVENELRNQTRLISKCPEDKYTGNPDLAANGLSSAPAPHYFPHQKDECPPSFTLVPRYNPQHNKLSSGKEISQLEHYVPQYAEFKSQ
jgi:hypothetical protein